MTINEATMKTGDTGRILEAPLTDGDGDPVNLTGVTLEFRWRPSTSVYATLILTSASGDVTVLGDPTAGLVRVSGFQAGDVDEAGIYVCEFVVTDSFGGEVTIPSGSYMPVRILAGIEPAP